MRIINIVDLFHPDAGYENNVLSKYMVKFGHEYIIMTTDLPTPGVFFDETNIHEKDRKFTKSTGVKIIRLHCKHYISGRSIWNYKKVLAMLNSLSPELVFFCGNDTYIAIRSLLRLHDFHMAVVTDSHMLEMASSNPMRKTFQWFYKKWVAPVIIRNNIYVIRQQNDDYVERCLGVPLRLAPWISFGSDIMLFHPDKDKRRKFRESYGISDDAFVVIYAGKLTKGKGGKLLANTIKKKLSEKREVVFLIVGNIHGEYGAEVQSILDKSENKILQFPTQKYTDLPTFYQAADLALFPKQCSLSFYDVEACGVPVLSEDNNINVDRCSNGNGWNFHCGDVHDFRQKLTMVIDMDTQEFSTVCHNAEKFVTANYSYEEKAKEYEKLFKGIVSNWSYKF